MLGTCSLQAPFQFPDSLAATSVCWHGREPFDFLLQLVHSTHALLFLLCQVLTRRAIKGIAKRLPFLWFRLWWNGRLVPEALTGLPTRRAANVGRASGTTHRRVTDEADPCIVAHKCLTPQFIGPRQQAQRCCCGSGATDELGVIFQHTFACTYSCKASIPFAETQMRRFNVAVTGRAPNPPVLRRFHRSGCAGTQ